MFGNEIGKSTETWEEKKNHDGSCEVKLHSVSEMTIVRGGDSMSLFSDTTLSADCRTFEPKYIQGISSEGGSKTFVEGINKNGVFMTKITKNGNSEVSSFSPSRNAVFFGMIFKKLSDRELIKGGKISIISEESLAESEISYSASKNADGTVSATIVFQEIPIKYAVSNKKVLYSEVQNGVIIYRLESLPETKNVQTRGNADVLQNTNLFKEGGITIKHPRKTKKTVFHIESADFASIPETCFQKKGKGTIAVTSNGRNCNKLPEASDSQPNIIEDSNNPEIVRVAQKIVSGSSNQGEMVKRIAEFVHNYIHHDYSRGVMSASEILRLKRGGSTAFVTLFAALARASGIPTKIVFGIALDNNGEFFVYTWNEVFADRSWVTVDPSQNMIPSDASRITLGYQGADSKSRDSAITLMKFLNTTKIFVRGFSNEE